MRAWDGAQVMRLSRERLLTRLVERQAISEELVKKLFAWRHFYAYTRTGHGAVGRTRRPRPPPKPIDAGGRGLIADG